MTKQLSNPGVGFPPPFLVLIAWVGVVVAEKVFPSRSFGVGFVCLGLGAGFLLSGLWLSLSCARLFRRHETAVEPWRASSFLVGSGPYRYSRNPIYLGFLLSVLGFGFLFATLWVLPFFLALFFYFRLWVIRKEERYLLQRFGADYSAYCKKVRRWL